MPADDTDPYPPDLIPYLNNTALAERIGAFAGASQDVAAAGWAPLGEQVYVNFANSGDWMRNSRPDLEKVIDAGVRTIVYDGDAVRVMLLSPLRSIHSTCFAGLHLEFLRCRGHGEYSTQDFHISSSLTPPPPGRQPTNPIRSHIRPTAVHQLDGRRSADRHVQERRHVPVCTDFWRVSSDVSRYIRDKWFRTDSSFLFLRT